MSPSRFIRFNLILRAIVALVVLTAVVNPTQAQQPARTPLPFERGEELIYQGEFTRGLLRGVEVADLEL